MKNKTKKSIGDQYLNPLILLDERDLGVRKIGQLLYSPKYWMPRNRMEKHGRTIQNSIM